MLFESVHSVRDLTRIKLLEAIFDVAAKHPEANLVDPDGRLRIQLAQLTNGLSREIGFDADTVLKINKCKLRLFGEER